MKKILLIPVMCAMCISCNSNSSRTSNGSDMQSDQSSDWAITARVKKTIMADSSLSANARMISVTTNNGVVSLSGTVASQEESRKVVRMVKNVDGVVSVDNQLTVSNS